MSNTQMSIDSILYAALEKRSPEQRAAYLEEACADDAELRAQVEKLIRAHFRAGSFLETPVGGECPTNVVAALDDTKDSRHELNPAPRDISFGFLAPCDVPGRLGRIGPYEIIDVIGQGGMGVVLQAHDPKLNRMVAVKVLTPNFGASPTAKKRFLREARAAAAVSHPHVITIHVVDEVENTPYIVMEYVDGQSLQERIDRDGTLHIEEILRIGSQVAAGLAAAHGQGLIHRDIKPANILLENGVERVKITDFGLARAVDDIGITHAGQVAGTPEFMSPEQAQGLVVEHRSDLFSLGSVLTAMCTGQSPFRAETTVAVLRRVCDDVPRPIRDVNPEMPEWLVAIINRLLAKDPDERFQTAEEVADLLSWHLADLQHPTKSPLPGLPANAPEEMPSIESGEPTTPALYRFLRRPWPVAGLVLLAVLMVLGITEATGVTHFATTVVQLATAEGTLVITIDDPAVSVTIEGEDSLITGAGTSEVPLKPGTYRLRAERGGKPVAIEQDLVRIARGGREVVNVTLLTPLELPPVPSTVYVDIDATGAGNGTRWEDAYVSLQVALAAARSGEEIWVAEGTYKPTDGGARTVAFHLKAGVDIYGGFDGSESDRDQRDWIGNRAVLSGDLKGNDATGDKSDNSYHVVYALSVPDATLDGFTITGGNADGVYPEHLGAGMYNDKSYVTLANLTFRGNSAKSGGAMYNYSGSTTLINVTFCGNSAGKEGGGMFSFSSSATLTNVTFRGNSAVSNGGGMCNSHNSFPTLTNVTFRGNSANSRGGGMCNLHNSSPTLTNCILWENVASTAPGIYDDATSSSNVTYSIVEGGSEGAGNLDVSPLFVRAPGAGPDGTSGTPDDYGDLRLQSDSPGINAGNSDAVPPDLADLDGDGVTDESTPLDLDLAPRIVGPSVDMGAYECQNAPPSADH